MAPGPVRWPSIASSVLSETFPDRVRFRGWMSEADGFLRRRLPASLTWPPGSGSSPWSRPPKPRHHPSESAGVDQRPPGSHQRPSASSAPAPVPSAPSSARPSPVVPARVPSAPQRPLRAPAPVRAPSVPSAPQRPVPVPSARLSAPQRDEPRGSPHPSEVNPGFHHPSPGTRPFPSSSDRP